MFFSTIPEPREQRELQMKRILSKIDDVDQGRTDISFGPAQNGIRLAILLLEPENATATKVHVAVVLRNDSPDALQYHGTDSSVLEFSAFDSAGKLLAYTRQGAVYGGPPLPGGRRPGGAEPRWTIPQGGQVIYEINLGDVFDIPAGKPVTFAAMAKIKGEDMRARFEVRSLAAALTPRPPNEAKSLYDEPEIPAWALARMKAYYATNAPLQRSNWATGMAQAKPGPARAMLQIGGPTNSNMTGVPKSLSSQVPAADVPKLPANTNKISDPLPPADKTPVEEATEPSQTKYYLGALFLALLV